MAAAVGAAAIVNYALDVDPRTWVPRIVDPEDGDAVPPVTRHRIVPPPDEATVENHNNQVDTLEHDDAATGGLFAARASAVHLLQALGREAPPWWRSTAGGDADADAAALRQRFRVAHAHQRTSRRAYNQYVVADDVHVNVPPTNPDDTALFPPSETVSWQHIHRHIQERRRQGASPDVVRPTVRTFRNDVRTTARWYQLDGAVGTWPATEAERANVTNDRLPLRDTLATYYTHHVLQHIERVAIASHLGSLVHQHLLLHWSRGGAGYPAEAPLSPADAALLGDQDGTYLAYAADAFQPVFPEHQTPDGTYRTFVPKLFVRHLSAASQEYQCDPAAAAAAADPDLPLVPTLAARIASVLDQANLTVVAVEPEVYDPHRLFVTPQTPGSDEYMARFFWTRADFVAYDRVEHQVVVGEIKNKFGASTQYHMVQTARDVQQVWINAWLISLVYRIRVDAVCLVYANRHQDVVVVRHPFAGFLHSNTLLQETLVAFLELPAMYVDQHQFVENVHEWTTNADRGRCVPWKTYDVDAAGAPDTGPPETPWPTGVAGAQGMLRYYCKQHGWQTLPWAYCNGRGGLVGSFAAAAAAAAAPAAPLGAPFTYHGGIDPYTAGRTGRVYPRTEPRYQRFLRTALLVQDVVGAAGRMAHLIACTCAPLRVAQVVLGSSCHGNEDHVVGTAEATCDRCRRWLRQYPAQGVAACTGEPARTWGPCRAHGAHTAAWKVRRAVLIRALHRGLNRHVVQRYQLDGAAYEGFVGLSQRPFWSERCKRTTRAALGSVVAQVWARLQGDATVPLRGGGTWQRRLRMGTRRAATVHWVMGGERGGRSGGGAGADRLRVYGARPAPGWEP